MDLSKVQGNLLCNDVVDRLSRWSSLDAALRCGGVEVKAGAILSGAMERIAESFELRVLREYECIDFAFFRPDFGREPRLSISAAMEVKFNYAKQIGEIEARLPDAVDQVRIYQANVSASVAYVLYFLAAPSISNVPKELPRDKGWAYWNADLAKATLTLRKSATEYGVPLLGESGPNPSLYCALLKC